MRSKTNMDQGARGWVIKTVQENFWRVADYYEFDDLVQDSWVVWNRIVTRYPDVTDIKQRMALFKRAFHNHIHDVSKKRTKHLSRYTVEADVGVSLDFLRDVPDANQDPDLVLMIKQLPPKILRMLERLYAEGREHPHRLRIDGTRETTNERLCRLAGLDASKRNVRAAVLAYARGAQIHPQYD